MNGKRIAAAVAGALVAGLVLGSVVSGYAATKGSAPTSATSAVAACGNAGLRLGAAMKGSGGRLLDVVAKLTGSTTAEITSQRADGKTFAQIAAGKNVSASDVVAEALKVRKTLLAEKVAAGAITQAQADAALSTMETRLNDRVNSANAACDGSGQGGMGRGRGAGCGQGAGAGCGQGAGAGCGGSCATAQ